MIRGTFRYRVDTPLPMVQVAVRLPGLSPQWQIIHFLIDTGAATTCIHPLDAMSVLLIPRERLADRRQWQDEISRTGIGGAARYFPVMAEVVFNHTDGYQQRFENRTLHVAQWQPTNQALPSILGWDLLQYFELTMNWPARTITLD